MSRVYLDHNATSPIREEVLACLREALETHRGNPSSAHRAGRAARAALDGARERVAAALGVKEDEIVFTSGGTEAVNLALLGERHENRGRGLLTSAAEHSAVLGAAAALERRGETVLRLPVDAACRVDPGEVVDRALGSREVGLVSVMAANNEIGTVQALSGIAEGLGSQGRDRPLFHTDAVQALGRIPASPEPWGVDLASYSVHKIGGPPGVGILYRRKGVQLSPLQHGGEQEGGVRPGTENVPAIVAAALAVELAVRELPETRRHTRDLCQTLWQEISGTLPGVELLGPPIASDERLPNTLDLLVRGVDGRMLVARLDLEGLEASAGSACASGSLEPSHVLLAMGLTSDLARCGIRLSAGRETTREHVHMAVEILRRTVRALR